MPSPPHGIIWSKVDNNSLQTHREAVITVAIPPQLDLPISYNIATTQSILAIRMNPKSNEWSLGALRRGLIPSWAKDEKIAYKTINAQVETLDAAASYWAAFRKGVPIAHGPKTTFSPFSYRILRS